MQLFSAQQQIQIVGTISNPQDYDQKFVYIFQVKNIDNTVESLSWIQGELSTGQSLDVSQSWTPETSGTYQIETYVWNSLNDPTALAPLMTTSIIVE